MQYAVERALPIADITPAVAYYKERRDALHKGLVDVWLFACFFESHLSLIGRS